jgi:hypothetical protein
MVEVEGNIVKQSISILIDMGSSHNYVTPKLLKLVLLRSASIISFG